MEKSYSFDYHLRMFHTLVDRLRENYGTEDDKKHLYYLDNQGQEALFAAQGRIRQIDGNKGALNDRQRLDLIYIMARAIYKLKGREALYRNEIMIFVQAIETLTHDLPIPENHRFSELEIMAKRILGID